MKKILILVLLLILIPGHSIATEAIVKDQLDALNISSFISEGEKYTKEAFPNLNVSDLITQSLTGKVDKGIFYKTILNLLGEEIVTSITILGSILAIVIIHSILKSIGENLGNDSTAQIAYFIEYILIITIIIGNFANIITSVKNTISNLVGFINFCSSIYW